MNNEIVKLTEDIGKVHIEISKLYLEITKQRAKKEILDAKRWKAKAEEINKKKQIK